MTSCSGPIPACSDVEQDPGGLLDAFLDPHQEGHRFTTVDDAVVIGECDIHHRPDLDFVVNCYGPSLDFVHAEDAGLRRVEDRRRHQRAVDAAIAVKTQHLDLPIPVLRLRGWPRDRKTILC